MSHRSGSPLKGRGVGPLSRLLASLLSVCLVFGTSPFAYAEDLSDDGAEAAAVEEIFDTGELEQELPVVEEEPAEELPVVEEEPAEELPEPSAPETVDEGVGEEAGPVADMADGQDTPGMDEGLLEAEPLPEPVEELGAPEAAEGSMPLLREGPPAADPVPNGFTAGPNGLLAYRIDRDQRIDVRGLFDGHWIGSTYGNRGYRPVVRIDEGSLGVEGASAILEQTGLAVTALPGFSEDGRAIFLRYSIEYPEESASDAIDFDFAIAGDIQIGSDDGADVMLMDSGRGFYMTSVYDVDGNGTPASLAIYFSNTAGVDEPTAVWIGRYGAWWDNLFSDQREGTDNVDSAFSISWQGLSLGQGESLTRGAASAVGELAEQALPEPEPEPEPEPAPAPEPEKPAPVQQASAKAAVPAAGDAIQNPLPLAMLGAAALLAGGALVVLRKETDQ